MQSAAILNGVAALIVIAYSLIRVHALRWSEAPLTMAACIVLAMASLTIACGPFIGAPPLSLGGTILHFGLALNSLADWEYARCEHASARACPVRFQL